MGMEVVLQHRADGGAAVTTEEALVPEKQQGPKNVPVSGPNRRNMSSNRTTATATETCKNESQSLLAAHTGTIQKFAPL